MDYFKKLLDLLKIEREEDRRSYQRLTEATSVSTRRANGLTWYPIAVKGSEMSRGDYLTVEIERTSHHEVTHQFRFGASAVIFSNHDPGNDRAEGTITYQNGSRVKITLRTDELPDWSRDGKLGIDLLFDDNSYDEMQNALRLAAGLVDGQGRKKPNEGDKERLRLIEILTGGKAPGFQQEPGKETKTMNETHYGRLNPSQEAAVEKILSAGELAIVHGPPGTGKTTTLVQAIKAMINRDGQPILVVAPSNAAVDLLSEKLSEEGLNTLRVGNPARVSERLMSLTLDTKMAEHPAMKEIKKLKKQASEFRDMAHKYKRNFGKAERDQRKALFDEVRSIMKSVEHTEQYILDDLLSRAQVIAATLVGANHYTVRSLNYRTVVIDEAGQALEPACWIPILKAQKVVLAGDPFQLSPTVKSEEAGKNGLSTTLLEKCIQLHPDSVVLLEEQYRMNERIMRYSSGHFYGDRLRAHSSVAQHLLFPGDSPLLFIDTAGCGFEEKQEEGGSTSNPEEAAFLFKHLGRLVTELKQYYPDRGFPERFPEGFPTIAIISPYRQQVQLLKESLRESTLLKHYGDKISANTIDSFQGQERDIVYISMTRSNPETRIGFLSEIRRMNVAMTRARKKLVVIGDSATLSSLAFYAGFISYAEKEDAYRSAWEFMDAD